MAETAATEVWAVQCPDGCGATGQDTYRANAHPTSCNWMMHVCPRCSEHDELLRPDEPTCPYPDTPEPDEVGPDYDPHQRRVIAPEEPGPA